ncbi:DUF3526 domain-containing protein [Aestuariibaculum marinum]|uniref:DUF3526 domain-containing protein n=1 Tax=Aestuariibaculum marinum TaxID=2683592 RepID=A0A8J6QEG9_9FLAO|nr:DUF3526 domain-containing protein [Aestuariibaculum marinum]
MILLISTLVLFAFATFNGEKNVEKRRNDISIMQNELHKNDSIVHSALTKIENGEQLDIPYSQLPTEPMVIGYRHPRLAVMQPEALSFISTGQSDMYTHFKSPTVYGNNFALDYSEMVNPVQLLFGNFDLAFVIIYILPLMIIAFTFNVLSKEKELGTLRLLGAQPIAITRWLLQKMAIRYILFTLITLIVLLLAIGIFSAKAFSEPINVIGLILIIAAYIFFWFVLAFVINIKINNSAKNALALIGLWLLIVLVLPATINQIGNSIYPTPSRLKMINEIRLIKKENEEKQNEIMSEYLRIHPELAQENDDLKLGFWHNYFASEKVMEEKTKPLLAEYDQQLQKQQDLISRFKFVSPAIMMQQALNKLAGTSEQHYNDYKKQVFEFSTTWRNYLVPMLFKNEKITKAKFNKLPKFEYQNRISSDVWINFLGIFLMCPIILLVVTRKQLKDKSAQTLSL